MPAQLPWFTIKFNWGPNIITCVIMKIIWINLSHVLVVQVFIKQTWQILTVKCWSERPLILGHFDQNVWAILTKMLGPSWPKCRAILTNGVWAVLDSRGRHGSAVRGGRPGQGPSWPAPIACRSTWILQGWMKTHRKRKCARRISKSNTKSSIRNIKQHFWLVQSAPPFSQWHATSESVEMESMPDLS